MARTHDATNTLRCSWYTIWKAEAIQAKDANSPIIHPRGRPNMHTQCMILVYLGEAIAIDNTTTNKYTSTSHDLPNGTNIYEQPCIRFFYDSNIWACDFTQLFDEAENLSAHKNEICISS